MTDSETSKRTYGSQGGKNEGKEQGQEELRRVGFTHTQYYAGTESPTAKHRECRLNSL